MHNIQIYFAKKVWLLESFYLALRLEKRFNLGRYGFLL